MRICPHCSSEVTGRRDKKYCRRQCRQNAWKKANPGNAIALYARDGERIREKSRAWGKANAKRKQARNRRWYSANLEAARSFYRSWRHANKDKMRKSRRAYRLANPELHRVLGQRRRALQLKATVGDIKVIILWEKAWKARKSVACYWCKAEAHPRGFHSDHIIALSIGGSHEISNLCVSCATCNSRKSDRTLDSWNRQIAEPVLL